MKRLQVMKIACEVREGLRFEKVRLGQTEVERGPVEWQYKAHLPAARAEPEQLTVDTTA